MVEEEEKLQVIHNFKSSGGRDDCMEPKGVREREVSLETGSRPVNVDPDGVNNPPCRRTVVMTEIITRVQGLWVKLSKRHGLC